MMGASSEPRNAGGLQGGGTVFRIVPQTNEFSVIRHLPTPQNSPLGARWIEAMFQYRIPSAGTNFPPAAKDDIIPAQRLRPLQSNGNTPGLPTVRINVLGNDSDLEHDTLSVTNVGTPRFGTATLEETSGRIIYQAEGSEVRNDSFSYSVSDGNGGIAVAHVIIRTPSKGDFHGPLVTRKDDVAGDPGTVVGAVSVRVSARRTAKGTVTLHGVTYPFAGVFNERNRLGAVINVARGFSEAIGVQLFLREDGTGLDNRSHAAQGLQVFHSGLRTG
jgi:hypothetical protein